ncbi:Alcohol acetyltransferase [Aspergillus melleus]|uniref:Alcohol acetyltransferase n=1 Tax=Aspergillus melleus TaxID=138277 RepID=A0ACC3AZP2_9EURO|nr:Alcohol acetyltransferase [Aspergillus melleus]
MDGVSVKIFLDALLEKLNNHSIDVSRPQPYIENGILKLPKRTTQCTPPAEHLTKFPIDRDLMIKALWSQLKSSISPPINPTQADWAPIQETPYKTEFRSFTLPNNHLTELIRACRTNNTTITGLLHALSLASLSSLLDDSRASAFESLTALDIRRFLPATHPRYPGLEPSRAMANYVTILNHCFDVSSVSQVRSKTSFVDDDDDLPSPDLLASIWSVASNTRQQIKSKLDQGLRNDMIGFMKPIADWRAEMSRAVLKPRRASWVVTNLGVLDSHGSNVDLEKAPGGSSGSSSGDQNDGKWCIREAQFVLGANVPAAALSISPIAVKGGSFCVTVSWQKCVLEEGIGERFTGDLERWMRFIGNAGESSLSGGESSTSRSE